MNAPSFLHPPTQGPSAGWMAGLLALSLLALSACSTTRTPDGVEVVRRFEADRFAGHWHEVARTENRFERGLTRASASYSLKADGTLAVVNRGWDPAKRVWRQAEGTARFVGDPSRGALEVAFFGPFYAGYNVVALDENYQWAMVIGSSRESVWVLSRTPTLAWHVREHLMERAKALGLDASKLVFASAAEEQVHARRAVRT